MIFVVCLFQCNFYFNFRFLDNDCSLVYFEDPENIKKWHPIHENVKEVKLVLIIFGLLIIF